jgi:hypothetical protein
MVIAVILKVILYRRFGKIISNKKINNETLKIKEKISELIHLKYNQKFQRI